MDDHTSSQVVRWMEPFDIESRDWLSRQPTAAWFRARLTALQDTDTIDSVLLRGDRRYELRRPSGEAQASVFCVEAGYSTRLIDARDLSDDGTVAITSIDLNPAGDVLAWSTIEGGADWQAVRFLDLSDSTTLPDVLTGLKSPALAWTGPRRFAYLQFPTPPAGQELTAPNGGTSIRLHALGTGQTHDEPVLVRDTATWMFPTVSTDRRYLVVEEAVGIVPARIHVLDLSTGQWRTVVDDQGPTSVVGLDDQELIVLSSVVAANGEIRGISLDGARTRTIVGESDQPLEQGNAHVVSGHVLTVRHGLQSSTVEAWPLAGGPADTIELPDDSFVTHLAPVGPSDPRALVEVQMPVGAQVLLVHDVDQAATSELIRWGTEPPFSVSVDLVGATSADGTQVPMRVLRRAEATPNRETKVLLLAYGGYGQHFLSYAYQPWQRAWLEAGGIVGHAAIRGGGELGRDWHHAATTQHKQRGVEDVLACAEWFEACGWSSTRQVALNGMSNGGLMVAAALTQRPDLFGAVIPEVAVLDLLRFHQFTAGHGWVREFGDIHVPLERAALEACSPLHQLQEGTAYPATLLLTADRDDRVPPGPHTYRFFDRMKQVHAGQAPVLMRVTRDAGHYNGRSLAEQVDERAAVLIFAATALDLTPPPDHSLLKEKP